MKNRFILCTTCQTKNNPDFIQCWMCKKVFLEKAYLFEELVIIEEPGKTILNSWKEAKEIYESHMRKSWHEKLLRYNEFLYDDVEKIAKIANEIMKLDPRFMTKLRIATPHWVFRNWRFPYEFSVFQPTRIQKLLKHIEWKLRELYGTKKL